MKLTVSLAFGFIFLVSGAFAGSPIVSITSAQPFTLDGTSVSSPGVTSWPMVLSDSVATNDGGALLKFKDGSTITLSPKTQVRLIGTDEAPKLVLIAGNLDYKLAVGSRLSIVTADKTITEGAGDDIGATGAPASTTRPRNAAYYYGVAGAGLAGLGLATDALLQPGSASAR